MSASLLPEEEDRLRELSLYGVLDAPPGPELDRITRLAARVFRVPIAVVSLVDRERQWFKSRHGIDLEGGEREHAFCAYTIREARPLIVPDTQRDERFQDNPLVVNDPSIRFYAGAPLVTTQNHRLGALCILDTRPREFSAEEMATLEEMAAMVVHELDARLLNERTHAELERRKRADQTMRATRDELEARVQQRTTALVEAEARYRGLFENAVEGIYQVQAGGGFLSVNPAYAHLFGYASPEDLLATVLDPRRLYVQLAGRTVFEERLAREGVIANLEVEACRSDGSRVWLSENARAVRDGAGRMVRYEGTVEDITARRAAEEALQRAHEELEDRVHERTTELALLNGDLRQQINERQHAEESARRSENKFRALLENAQDLTSLLTPEGVMIYKSPSIQHVLGYQPDELIGKNLLDSHIHPDDVEAVRMHLRRVVEDGKRYVRNEMRVRHQDGSWRLLESVSSVLPPDFPVIGLVVNSRDITERRRNEHEIAARARHQAAVAELSHRALREEDLSSFFQSATELVTRVLKVSRTGVAEFLPGGEQMLIRSGYGFPENVVGRLVIQNWHGQLPGGNPEASAPLVVPDLRQVVDYSTLPSLSEGAAISAASAMIHDGDRPYGTLCVLSTVPREFTPEERLFIQTVADLLSTVVESRRHRAASREVEARYQRIVAYTPGMVYQLVLHTDGRFTFPFISEGCRQIFELEPARVAAKPSLFGDMVHPNDRLSIREAIVTSARTLKPLSWEGRLQLPSGVTRWIAARMHPERQPNGDTFLDGVVFDVSEIKRAEGALRTAKEEAERANNAKSEFLSRMSHELRTPLNAILGFGQLLALESLNPIQSSSVDQILAGGRHLLDLVNEVLDIARIEAGKVEMAAEAFEVNEAAAAILRFVQPMAEQYRVKLVHEVPKRSNLLVQADHSRFNQVLLNLLSNAIKYNHEGGEVRVTCRRRAKQSVRITVADTGPGLSPEEQTRLFSPFQRLKAPERGITGTGIGLTLSKGLIEAMGGTIGVRSAPGKGSRFYVDLPVPTNDTPIADPAFGIEPLGGLETFEPVREEPQGKTLLHIDDQPANLTLVERVLGTREDLRLLTATDGRGGVAQAREHRPDLILLDLHLPDINGEEVLRRLRNERRTRDIPVIVLSADATPSQIQRLRSLGVRDYLTKPFKIDTLLRAVDAVLAEPKK